MSGIQVVKNDAGDVHVGFDADGTFIPFAHVSANRIAQLQERAANLAELAKADDAASVARHDEAVAGLPYSAKTTATKGGTS